MELPKFRYSPNAFKIGVFKEEEGTCSVCKQERNLKYDSSFYSAEEPDYICPWCIADGHASELYEGEFNDAEGIEIPFDYEKDGAIKAAFDEKMQEVTQRTPSYVSWQQEAWLSHCNEPCAFIGYVDGEMIKPILDQLKADIDNSGYDGHLVTEHLSKGSSPAGYLFQCLHCGTHRLHIDSD